MSSFIRLTNPRLQHSWYRRAPTLRSDGNCFFVALSSTSSTPHISPRPRTSPTFSREANCFRPAKSFFPFRPASSTSPSRSRICKVARATAQQVGWPEYVNACIHLRVGGASARTLKTLSDIPMPPNGRYPDVIPLAKEMMSGSTFQWSSRNHQPPGALDGFSQESGDGIGAFPQDRFLQLIGRCSSLADIGIARNIPIGIRGRDMNEARYLRAEHRRKCRNPGRVHRSDGYAVISVLPADDFQLLRLALTVPEKPCGLDCTVICISAARREKEMIYRWITELRQPLGQLDCGDVRMA